jgi:hypothetical protein
MNSKFVEFQSRNYSLDKRIPRPAMPEHRLTGMYLPKMAQQLAQAAHLAGLGHQELKPGANIEIPPHYLQVDRGFRGLVVFANSPEDVDTFWFAAKSLEQASEARKYNP